MQHRIIFKYLSGRKRGTNEVFPLPRFASELKIGRDPICEVRFDPTADTAVSRHHASLQWTDGEQRSYTIVDLLSSNGTFVNSRRVENSSPLKDGDIVEFGRGGPTARVEIQSEGSFDTTLPPATKSLEKAALAVDYTMKHKDCEVLTRHPFESSMPESPESDKQIELAEAPPAERRRGIYLLPNFLTTCAMFAGYFAIVSSINKQWEVACIAVFVAAFFDGIDGRVARLTNTQSAFGVQYDSLSDLVSFGLAPSLIMYNWSLESLRTVSPTLGKLGWLAAFVYAACAALRLARFNVQFAVQDKRFFQGLASPAAAGMMVSFVWAVQKLGGDGAGVRWLTPFLTVTVALAMVSNLRYFSFKSWPEKVPFVWAIATMLLIVAIALEPPVALVAFFFAYVLSGPVMTFIGMRQRRAQALAVRNVPLKAPDAAP